MKEEFNELLETTTNYEEYSFLKGVAGLYFQAAIVLNLGLFGLLVLEALSDGSIFYDKGIAQFTLVQVGQVVVLVGLIGTLIYRSVVFLSDQVHYTFLSTPERKKKITRISFQPVLLGVIYALTMIILAIIGRIEETTVWLVGLVFLAIYLISIWRQTGHWPTLIPGFMILTLSVLIVFSPEPLWTAVIMVLTSASYLGAIFSHIYAQKLIK